MSERVHFHTPTDIAWFEEVIQSDNDVIISMDVSAVKNMLEEIRFLRRRIVEEAETVYW